MNPGSPAVGGRSPTNVGGAAIEKATNLKGGDDGVAKCKAIRLDLRFVHTVWVGVRVAANPRQWFISKCDKRVREDKQ